MKISELHCNITTSPLSLFISEQVETGTKSIADINFNMIYSYSVLAFEYVYRPIAYASFGIFVLGVDPCDILINNLFLSLKLYLDYDRFLFF